MSKMLKLSSTSALVLLWAQQASYKSTAAIDYLSHLDLEDGKTLYKQCEEVCPYYDEVIKNRKKGVLHLLNSSFSNDEETSQLVIAGAGFDALSLEIMELYPHVNIFEIDEDKMQAKSRIVTKLNSTLKKNINFIEGNILNISYLCKSLIAHGWDPLKSTLLVLEGITYYLPTESLQNLIHAINPDLVIFEFLKQRDEISTDRVNIPDRVFGPISSQCGLSNIVKYN